MKLVYDPEVDILSLVLSDAPVAESDQNKPGLILDSDEDGNVVSLVILDASNAPPTPCRSNTPLRRHANLDPPEN